MNFLVWIVLFFIFVGYIVVFQPKPSPQATPTTVARRDPEPILPDSFFLRDIEAQRRKEYREYAALAKQQADLDKMIAESNKEGERIKRLLAIVTAPKPVEVEKYEITIAVVCDGLTRVQCEKSSEQCVWNNKCSNVKRDGSSSEKPSTRLSANRTEPKSIELPAPSGDAFYVALAGLAKGETALEAGRLDDAVDQYTLAIRAAPDLAEAYVGRGSAYEKKGMKSKALADFRMALKAARHIDEVSKKQALLLAQERIIVLTPD